VSTNSTWKQFGFPETPTSVAVYLPRAKFFSSSVMSAQMLPSSRTSTRDNSTPTCTDTSVGAGGHPLNKEGAQLVGALTHGAPILTKDTLGVTVFRKPHFAPMQKRVLFLSSFNGLI
jgi:hypothetical protein